MKVSTDRSDRNKDEERGHSIFTRTKNSYVLSVDNRSHRPFLGFTLLELVVVIAILGIASSIGVSGYYSYIEKAKIIKAIADLRIIEKEIILFEATNGAFPLSLVEIGRANFKDPWGNPYEYLNFATIKGKGKQRKDHMMVPINEFFDLYSRGKDGESKPPLTAKASHDDIIRGHSGRFIGPASEYT